MSIIQSAQNLVQRITTAPTATQAFTATDVAREMLRLQALANSPASGPVLDPNAGRSTPEEAWDEAHAEVENRRIEAEQAEIDRQNNDAAQAEALKRHLASKGLALFARLAGVQDPNGVFESFEAGAATAIQDAADVVLRAEQALEEAVEALKKAKADQAETLAEIEEMRALLAIVDPVHNVDPRVTLP